MLAGGVGWATITLAAAPPPPPAQRAAPKPGPPHVVTVHTRDFTVEFGGERAWTIQRIQFRGKLVADRVGFYGTVYAPIGGRWIGTGHNEGGIERVESAELKMDNAPLALEHGATARGHRAELTKHSWLGPIRLQADYVVTDDTVVERHRYEFTEEVRVGVMYAFMHPWLARTTEWIAEATDGTRLEGAFDNAGDFELRKDVNWTAIHDPEARVAMLVWYPIPLPGQGHRTGFWDKTVYHKQYNQIYDKATVAKGTRLDLAMILRGVETPLDAWKTAAAALAAETNARFKRGDTSTRAGH